MAGNYFSELYAIDFGDKVKEKSGLKYASWAAVWAELKKKFPDAQYIIYEQPLKWFENGTIISSRPWFDDGKSAWVKTGVVVNGIEHIERLPILDFKNKAVPANTVTSDMANKSIQRSLAKACARHGVGLYLYEGEDVPEEIKLLEELRDECFKLVQEKVKLSDTAKERVQELCMAADENANGDPRLIEDLDALIDLKTKLKAVRKTSMKTADEELLKETKQKIISLCIDLGGNSNEKLMEIIKSYVPSGNPNALKSVNEANACLNAVKKIIKKM